MSIITKFTLYLNTLRYLKFEQILYHFLFILKNFLFKRFIIKWINLKIFFKYPDSKSLCKKPIVDYHHDLSKGSFHFLNKRVVFHRKIRWNDVKCEKLWLYHLHYFDYILNLGSKYDRVNPKDVKEVIIDWIENNPVGYKNGWEPYPLSLRIVNWIFYFQYQPKVFNENKQYKELFLESLFKQCAYLSFFIEFHLQANHLFKNGKALLIGGLFFKNKKWITKGLKITRKELDKQILADGGHFERSPMYHALVSEDILDLANFISAYGLDSKYLSVSYSLDIAKKMLNWLNVVCAPDRKIPLFGDSAFGMALELNQIIEYFNSIKKSDLILPEIKRCEPLSASGYFVFRSNKQYMIIDGGELGASYQPGHAHCDLLSYEYSYNNLRFIVDTGIGEYLETELRQNCRSIYAHNTVVVNETDQAELWKAFRMGRRVEPSNISTDVDSSSTIFEGTYHNKINQKSSYQHKRVIKFNKKETVKIEDFISGNNIESIESLIHLHPECIIKEDDEGAVISRDNIYVKIIFSRNDFVLIIKDWFYIPEYGKIIKSKLISLKPVNLNLQPITYTIIPQTDHSKPSEQH